MCALALVHRYPYLMIVGFPACKCFDSSTARGLARNGESKVGLRVCPQSAARKRQRAEPRSGSDSPLSNGLNFVQKRTEGTAYYSALCVIPFSYMTATGTVMLSLFLSTDSPSDGESPPVGWSAIRK